MAVVGCLRRMAVICCYFLMIFMSELISQADASRGDASYIFQNCLHRCEQANCSNNAQLTKHLSWSFRLTGWTCTDDCKYWCMWNAVAAFKLDRLPLPQFYGKWPFVRLIGMQEPASALSSLANLLCNLFFVVRFVRVVPTSSPMYGIWLFYSIAVCNAWFWSTVFHTRDTPFTEKMDYFCALSFFLVCLVAVVQRFYVENQMVQHAGDHIRRPLCFYGMLFTGASLFFVGHTGYLSFVAFDYRYNMAVNISVASTASLSWAMWAWRHRRAFTHARFAFITQILILLFSITEMCDFEPLWWILDAHALWHVMTVPLPIVWYRFIIADCLYLEEVRRKNGGGFGELPLLSRKVNHKLY